MPTNLTNVMRTIQGLKRERSSRSPHTAKNIENALMNAAGKSGTGPFGAFSSVLANLPATLPESYPYTSSDVAGNGDLVRIPVRAKDFDLVYVEGDCDTAALQKIVYDNGIGSRVWDEADRARENPAIQHLLGNVAFYGIQFKDGDIGQYQEFFLLIKLSTATEASGLHDMFVWRLCVDSEKAAAWGDPWHYPKKFMSTGLALDFDTDGIARSLMLNGTADDGTAFPYISFKRNLETSPYWDPKLGSGDTPQRWSHEEMGGGFSFVNPKTAQYPRGYAAPIENQGEYWSEAYDKPNKHVITVRGSGEFAVLNDTEWRSVLYGRDFQAVAKAGSPRV